MKRFFSVITAAFLSLSAYSTDLSKDTPAWVTVLSGSIIAPPARTSYGYAAVCDGKQLCGFTEEGKLLWQKNFRNRFSPFITRGPADLLITVIKDTSVQLLNPGGMVLWTEDAGFKITENPLNGRDGRFFLRGKNYVSCMTIHGNQRWKIELSDQDTSIPLCTLDDGSILAFLEKKFQGKSIARRISPFGLMSEEIIFTGNVSSCASSNEGVLLAFTDGSIGMCSINQKGETFSKWVIPSSLTGSSSSCRICTEGFAKGNAAALPSGGKSILFINTLNGKIRSQAQLETAVDTSSITGMSNTVQGFFVSDRHRAFCMSANSKEIWNASWSGGKNFNYIYATDSGYLVFSMSSWSVEAFRMKQNVSSSGSSFNNPHPSHYRKFYPECWHSDSISGEALLPEEMKKYEELFKTGKNSHLEASILSVLAAEAAQMQTDFSTQTRGGHAEQPFFTVNTPYCVDILTLMAESGLTVWSGHFASMMKKTRDDTLLLALLRCAAISGWDGDSSMLSCIDYLTRSVISPSSDPLLKAVCDATLEICRFMGKPALIEKGRQLLSLLLTSRFSTAVNEYSRHTLDKIMELDL